MKNLAGASPEVADTECRAELELAGIPIRGDAPGESWPEFLRSKGEVPSNIIGYLGSGPDGTKESRGGWRLERAWYYWVARWEPPATVTFTMEDAIELHKTHGTVVRVYGHCGCPAPDEWWPENGTPDHYHIDTQEGLTAFAKAVNVIKLDNWEFLESENADPYLAPEMRQKYLRGEVTDHPNHENGTTVNTSYIIRKSGKIIYTASGHKYRIGNPHPQYAAWCKDNNLEQYLP